MLPELVAAGGTQARLHENQKALHRFKVRLKRRRGSERGCATELREGLASSRYVPNIPFFPNPKKTPKKNRCDIFH